MSKIFYEESLPPAELRDYIRCFWLLDSNGQVVDIFNKFPPSGCIDIFFQQNPCFYIRIPDSGLYLPLPRFFSPLQFASAIDIRLLGSIKIFGIRLQPHAGSSVLKTSLSKIRNAVVDVKETLGSGFQNFGESLVDTICKFEAFNLMNQFCLAGKSSFHAINENVKGMCSDLVLDPQMPIKELYSRYPENSRLLREQFLSHVGLLPKQFSNIVQIGKTISIMDLYSNKYSLTSLALTTQHCDQSHFIKKFRSVMKINPGGFFNEENPINSFFNSFSSISSLSYSPSVERSEEHMLP